jgi:hypothetical protein
MSAPVSASENAERAMRLVVAAAWDRIDDVQDILAGFADEGDAAMFSLCYGLAAQTGFVGNPFGEGDGVAGFSLHDEDSGEQMNPDASTGDAAAVVRAMRFLAAYTNGDADMCSTLFATADDGGTWIAALLRIAADYTRLYLLEHAAGLPHVACDACRLGPVTGDWQPVTFTEGMFGWTYSTHHPDSDCFGTDLLGGAS